jgi:hypothetical protein
MLATGGLALLGLQPPPPPPPPSVIQAQARRWYAETRPPYLRDIRSIAATSRQSRAVRPLLPPPLR